MAVAIAISLVGIYFRISFKNPPSRSVFFYPVDLQTSFFAMRNSNYLRLRTCCGIGDDEDRPLLIAPPYNEPRTPFPDDRKTTEKIGRLQAAIRRAMAARERQVFAVEDGGQFPGDGGGSFPADGRYRGERGPQEQTGFLNGKRIGAHAALQ
ncbi:hypothetical protein ACLOJK_031345 [Asimina triloba]